MTPRLETLWLHAFLNELFYQFAKKCYLVRSYTGDLDLFCCLYDLGMWFEGSDGMDMPINREWPVETGKFYRQKLDRWICQQEEVAA